MKRAITTGLLGFSVLFLLVSTSAAITVQPLARPSAHFDGPFLVAEGSAITVAQSRAEALWGEVEAGPAIVLVDRDGSALVYCIPFMIGGDPFPADETIISEVSQGIELMGTGGPSGTTDLAKKLRYGIGQYGTIYVSARSYESPIAQITHGLPPFYTEAPLVKEEAERELGESVNLEHIYYNWVFGQVFEFDSGRDSALMHGFLHNRLPREETLSRIPKVSLTRRPTDAVRSKWAMHFEGPLPQAKGRGDVTVPNYELIPEIIWTQGCTPTAATMAIGYWDHYLDGDTQLGYGHLIDHWEDQPTYADPDSGDIHSVPNLTAELVETMHTSHDGGTSYYDICPGIEGAANASSEHTLAYKFDANRRYSGDPEGSWSAVTETIDEGLTFVWSISAWAAGSGHSLCAWGYNEDLGDNFIVVYDTWTLARQDYLYDMYLGFEADYTVVDAVEPDCHDRDSFLCGDDNQCALLAPAGQNYLSMGSPYTITWRQFGADIEYAKLFYSTDAGHSWTTIANIVDSEPGENTYQWNVPGPDTITASNFCRVKIEGYAVDGDRDFYYVAGDGSRKNFSIIRDLSPPSPNPPQWFTEPYAVDSTTIEMLAPLLNDISSPVRYFFECTSDSTLNSGWQTSRKCNLSNLTPGKTYSFRFTARDSSPDENETQTSTVASVKLPGGRPEGGGCSTLPLGGDTGIGQAATFVLIMLTPFAWIPILRRRSSTKHR